MGNPILIVSIFCFNMPHENFPYLTFIDEQLIFYTITQSYSRIEHSHSFAIAAGDSIKYQLTCLSPDHMRLIPFSNNGGYEA